MWGKAILPLDIAQMGNQNKLYINVPRCLGQIGLVVHAQNEFSLQSRGEEQKQAKSATTASCCQWYPRNVFIQMIDP